LRDDDVEPDCRMIARFLVTDRASRANLLNAADQTQHCQCHRNRHHATSTSVSNTGKSTVIEYFHFESFLFFTKLLTQRN